MKKKSAIGKTDIWTIGQSLTMIILILEIEPLTKVSSEAANATPPQ